TLDLPAHCFITAFAGVLDSGEHRIHYLSAGQAPLLHYHAGRDELEWLDASSVPIGILAGAPMIAPAPIDLGPGDIFALITDGFFEYHNGDGEQFGRERIGELLRSHRRAPLEALIETLRDCIGHFAGDSPQEDDMTVVLVRRTTGRQDQSAI
ncbi:MAG: serine/threonine-protein phosphatase, partial [Acidobacteria bacterium]|nr:serine/threonine-protein phosphatase [Acidobacteriota bacterium]